jgi:hypothetical protein
MPFVWGHHHITLSNEELQATGSSFGNNVADITAKGIGDLSVARHNVTNLIATGDHPALPGAASTEFTKSKLKYSLTGMVVPGCATPISND